MSAFTTHFAFEFRTGIRNRGLLFLTYLFPLIFYLMMGFIMPPINPTFLAGFVPAMMTFAVLAAALLGIPDPLVTARSPASSAAIRSTACRPRRSCASPR